VIDILTLLLPVNQPRFSKFTE